jgi:hypothetical protein
MLPSTRVRRCLFAVVVLFAGLVAVVVSATPANAVRTTGWATWTPITGTSNHYATTMQLPASGFPKATVASDSRGNVTLPSGASTFLGGATDSVPTDVGIKYGSSRNHAYITLRPKADNATSPSTTTYTFATPTPETGWAFVLGDIDADQVRISAKDANGVTLTPVQIDQWKLGHNVFNYAGGTDLPTWNAATSTLVGNAGAVDTDGAAGWFEPNIAISSLTFIYTQRSGFPVYQTWFASVARTISGTVSDVSTAGGSCPVDSATVRLVGPHGEALATTHPVGGAYSFGQYATQAGYVVSIEWPAGCVVVGPQQQTLSTAGSDATADFSLRQVIPQPVSGTVTTTGGTPVAGVQITLTPPGGGTPVVTTTDSAGNYLFDNNAEVAGYGVAVTGMPAGFTLSGAASRNFDIAPGTPVSGQDFTLTELPSISGTVSGGGDPLGGVTVTLTPNGGGSPVTTVTLGDGTYAFDHVPLGGYDITVTPPDGYGPAVPLTGVVVGAGGLTGQDFALSRPGSLSGQVTDADTSDPLPGVQIAITGPAGTVRVPADSDGSFFLGGLDPGTYTIEIAGPDGYVAVGPQQHVVTITAAGEIRGGQDFAVRRTFTVNGVVTAGGDPVPGAVITVDDAGGTAVGSATSSAAGTFSVPGLITAPGYVATIRPPSGFRIDGPTAITFAVNGAPVTGLDFALIAVVVPSTGSTTPTTTPVRPRRPLRLSR